MNTGTPKSTKATQSKQVTPAGTSQGGGKQQKKKKDKENSEKKQRVFINQSNPNTMSTTPRSANNNKSAQSSLLQPTNTANYFGSKIPNEVMESVLFRFLYNIPENEKNNTIRICFHIELAHWFYLDFYCPDNGEPPIPNCRKVGFHQFVRQVFANCHYLEKWRTSVDKIIEEFRHYKSNVPTYGVIMLDATLNYVLLIQGYYAAKNSWGFPKGKINEGELPLECAIREAFEEVGFDAKDHITDKVRPLQSFIGETLVRLYIATDVPMDFPFQPHLRKEIRKISWFSVWDLPKDRNDEAGCSRLGLQPNNFYSVLPFIQNICDFIQRERTERNKPKCSLLKQEGKSEGGSAFQPVIPRASSNQKLSHLITPNTSMQNLPTYPPTEQEQSSSSNKMSAVENLFKPLRVEPDNAQPQSFTGQSFLDQFVRKAPIPISPSGGATKDGKDKEQQIPKNPAGVIGGESRRRNKEIKQPKPLHPSKLIVNVYEAPPEQQQQQQSSPEGPQKQKKPKVMADTPLAPPTMTMAQQSAGEGNEIVNMLRSSIGKKEQLPRSSIATQKKDQLPKATVQPQVTTQVRLCEAWKKFTFDKSCFQKVNIYPS